MPRWLVRELVAAKRLDLIKFSMDGFHVFHLNHTERWRHPANISDLWICLLLLLFSHLRELTLEDSGIRDTTPLSTIGIGGLEFVSLYKNDSIHWNILDLDFLQFANLTHLYLSFCQIKNHIDNFVFPDFLNMLDLSNNRIISVEKVFFLKCHLSLCLNSDLLTSPCNPGFQKTLQKL